MIIRPGQRFDVGRGGATIVLNNDNTVSRKHAQLELRPGGSLYVADLNSRNGTFLAGVLLKPYVPTRVETGMSVRIGNHTIRAEIFEGDDGTQNANAAVRSSDEPLLPGDEIELLGVIGAGSYGRVYAAHQKLMDRRVAVKFLHSRKRPGDLERFLREGRLACRVRSRFVVEVYDFRVTDDRVYLLMELVNGLTLKDRLSLGPPISIPEALIIAGEVAEGLAAVHLEGIVHRDIKPSNILLSPDVAKLSDFGIAKDVHASDSLTPQDSAIGSLPYVSPEQTASAARVDLRADIYSLGATLYHMLAGRPPFSGGLETVLNVVESKPMPLAKLVPNCPVDVRRLVEGMIHKDPNRRPASAESVARQLEELKQLHYPSYVATTVVQESKSAQTSAFPGVGADEATAGDSPVDQIDDLSPLLGKRP